MKTFYMVLRLSATSEAQAPDSIPTKRHANYADALNEAYRLTITCPGAHAFVVMKAVSGYENKLVSTFSILEIKD